MENTKITASDVQRHLVEIQGRAALALLPLLRRAMTPAEWKTDSDQLTAKLEELDAKQQAYTETEKEMAEYVLTFAELMSRASSIFKLANDIERRKIVHLVFTELTFYNGELAGYKATEGTEMFLKRPVGVDGGASWLFTELPTIYRAIRDIRVPWAQAV